MSELDELRPMESRGFLVLLDEHVRLFVYKPSIHPYEHMDNSASPTRKSCSELGG